MLTRSLSSLYKQKIKYILCSLPCIWKRPCFLRKICQYKARGKPEEKTECNRGIFATSPSRLCNQHGRLRMPKCRSALIYIEKTLLEIIHRKMRPNIKVRNFHLQYRSEISGLRTRKTHARFSRKRVSKNACENARLRAFARISCACFLLLFTLITVLCVAFFFTTENKTKGNSLKRR